MSDFISSQGGQAHDVASSPGGQAQDVIIMEDHLMTVPDVNQLEALPSLSTTELGSLGGALHDHRCDSSRGTSTSRQRDSPVWGVPESSTRIAQDQVQDQDQDLYAVNILDSSSPSSGPRPLQEDGLIRHEECHDDFKATKTGGHCRTTVLNIIVKPRDLDSSPRNGLTLRPGVS